MVCQFVQSDAHIHYPCQETQYKYYISALLFCLAPHGLLHHVVNCSCHGNHCGRLYMSPRVYGHRFIVRYKAKIHIDYLRLVVIGYKHVAMAMVMVGYTCVQSFIVMHPTIT